MTPAKRHQIRAKQEAMQKARKEERLGLDTSLNHEEAYRL